MSIIYDQTLETVKECLPAVVDTVSDLVSDKSGTNTVSSSSNTSSSTRQDSPHKSVWEEPVKMRVFGVFSGEGKLKAFLIAAGAMTLCAIIYKRTTSPPKGDTQKQKRKLPQTTPALTTNRDNIGKPIDGFKWLIPHLAYCGDNVLLWGESKIGKSRFGVQLSIDLVHGHHSSLFPSESCTTPNHYVFYYAFELDEQMIRDRYGDSLNQYENLQIIYASPLIGNTSAMLEDLKKRLESVPQNAHVAVFIDTFAKAVGWGHSYDEKKAGELLQGMMILQNTYMVSNNTIISNIYIAHQKNDKKELEAPNCVRQTINTEIRFVMEEKDRKYHLEHLRANNMKTLDEPLRLHVEEKPFVSYVADEIGKCGEVVTVDHPFNDYGQYDWEKLRPLLQKLTNEGKSQTEMARIITDTFGKETNQQSVSAALKRLGIKE